MSTLARSMKNVFGKKARTIVVVVIIGFSLGVFLSMSIVSENISESARTLSEEMEKTATVSAAGGNAFFSTEPMPDSIIPTIGSVEHVDSVQKMIVEFVHEGSATGRPSMIVQGMDPAKELILMNGGSFEIVEGRNLKASDNGSMVAIIGQAVASSKDVGVDDLLALGNSQFKVVGILESGTRMGDSAVIVPYQMAKAAFDSEGPSMVYVTADKVGNIDVMVEDLREALGDEFDVVAPTDRGEAQQESIDAIESNSLVGAYISLMTGVAIMIFIMVLITRERFREIGIMKAIGFKNSRIVTQLLTESMTLAALGFVVGVIIAVMVGPSISSMMVSSSSPTATETAGSAIRPGAAGGAIPIAEVDFALEPDLMIITLAMALALGIIGSLYPVLKALKLKPAEALRYE